MKIKDYGVEVIRILDVWQIMLYKTNGLNELGTYVSKDNKGEYKIVFVFDKIKSYDLFLKYRKHELDIGKDLINPYEQDF